MVGDGSAGVNTAPPPVTRRVTAFLPITGLDTRWEITQVRYPGSRDPPVNHRGTAAPCPLPFPRSQASRPSYAERSTSASNRA
jgi:hypothetical protein